MYRDAYQQETEISLLLRLCTRLEDRAVIDVGAARGGFIEAFLSVGCAPIYAFEPFPAHARYLRHQYASEPDVRIFETALGNLDQTAILHVARDHEGNEHD